MLVLSCNRIASLHGLAEVQPHNGLDVLELQGNCVAEVAQLQHLAPCRPRSVCLSRDGLGNPVTCSPDYAAAMLSVCSAAVIIDDVPPSVLTRSVASPPTPPAALQHRPRPRLGEGGRAAEEHEPRAPLSRIDNVLQRHKARAAADEAHAGGLAASKALSSAAAGSGLSAEAREVLGLELRMERLEFLCKQQQQQQQQQRFSPPQLILDQAPSSSFVNAAALAAVHGDSSTIASPPRAPARVCFRSLAAPRSRLALLPSC